MRLEKTSVDSLIRKSIELIINDKIFIYRIKRLRS